MAAGRLNLSFGWVGGVVDAGRWSCCGDAHTRSGHTNGVDVGAPELPKLRKSVSWPFRLERWRSAQEGLPPGEAFYEHHRAAAMRARPRRTNEFS